MNTLVRLIVFIFCSTVSLLAQDFQGVATYKTQRSLDIEIDSTQVGGSEIQQQLMEMLKKQFQKTYILTFNKNTSIYEEDEALAPPTNGNSMVFVSSSGGSDILFKDFKNKLYTNQVDAFGKQFIIKDTIYPIEWTLHNDTKNIGTYTCFKATYKKKVPNEIMSLKLSDDKDSKLDSNEETTAMTTRTVTAWYTPQIPVSGGPEKYQGLPGLILEVSDGDLVILCSKISLNPQKTIEIEEPKKGELVTQKAFDEIMTKKMEQMSEQYNGRESDENTIQIRINN